MTWAAPAQELARRTHCPKGHSYTPENTYRLDDGYRRCRECRLAAMREYQRKRREEAA